jgi:hypothetical protein
MKHVFVLALLVAAACAPEVPTMAETSGGEVEGAAGSVASSKEALLTETSDQCLRQIQSYAQNWFRTQYTPFLNCGSNTFMDNTYNCQNSTKWFQVSQQVYTTGLTNGQASCSTERAASALNGSWRAFTCGRNYFVGTVGNLCQWD